MTVGTPTAVERGNSHNHHRARVGYTSISTGAMEHLAAAIAAHAFDVPRGEVRAVLGDEQGSLIVSLALALSLPGPGGDGRQNRGPGYLAEAETGGATVFERAAASRAVLTARMQELAGTIVSRVDVRFTGIHNGHHTRTRRVA
ncbi:hypothetical protein [Arthrobacter cryoconiti]|uniref:Uncharacterized protein n=1 Tax=Arthrobacter cryoconiti TaxID=748907 RepID=A0ABV8R129_9MICC|nr:hypothetical protein [Arthrobacter cryoconiti]MCC9067679.1 hypothetical protein [Arthrobacter cryoconiti]